MVDYQWEVNRDIEATQSLSHFQSTYGVRVVERDLQGVAKKVEIHILNEYKFWELYCIGDHNNWEKKLSQLEAYKFQEDTHGKYIAHIEGMKHKGAYKILAREGDRLFFLQDPAATFFDDDGNCVFWDYEDPSTYKQQYPCPDTRGRSINIMQSDIPGLVKHYANSNGVLGKDIHERNLFRFIAESGVIEEIAKLGFTAVQFLPFAQSIDGENWKFRYLVPFQYAIQKNWGTPDDFALMIDMFHRAGIAVIGDFVIGHLPHKDFGLFGQSFQEYGIHLWKGEKYPMLFLREETSWGTMRLDFDSQRVRQFFIDSCLHFLKHYRIDGLRIDNVDGILRYGDNGDGPERPSGRIFLRELMQSIYHFKPEAMVHLEAHYFYEDNAKLLVAPLDSDPRALGASAYNSSRLTYYFHSEYMLKSVEQISAWKFKHIRDEKEWGKSRSTVADFHNHDAAAGLMAMRATGSYAYDCMVCTSPANHVHALGKIKVMQGLLVGLSEGRILNLLQTFLLQTGTFEHDASIHWFLTFNQANRACIEYMKDMNILFKEEAFWQDNACNSDFLNIDDDSKILVIERNAPKHDQHYVMIVHLGAIPHYNYKIPIKYQGQYEVVLSSDDLKYAGQGLATYPEVLQSTSSSAFELLSQEIELGTIAPYGVVVLKKK